MKNLFLQLLITISIFGLSGCSKDDAQTEASKLPPETQTGANTFGVTINGKVYIPRDPTGSLFGTSTHAITFWTSPDGLHTFEELEVVDGKSAVGFQMIIHIQNLFTSGAGQYQLKKSNFHKGIDSDPLTHIYFKIWDANISNYAYYGSIENQGELNITRYDNINYITSGNFRGKFVRNDNPNEFIQITDGRFDIGPGLYTKVFP
jgi:hypothetical protein